MENQGGQCPPKLFPGWALAHPAHPVLAPMGLLGYAMFTKIACTRIKFEVIVISDYTSNINFWARLCKVTYLILPEVRNAGCSLMPASNADDWVVVSVSALYVVSGPVTDNIIDISKLAI